MRLRSICPERSVDKNIAKVDTKKRRQNDAKTGGTMHPLEKYDISDLDLETRVVPRLPSWPGKATRTCQLR